MEKYMNCKGQVLEYDKKIFVLQPGNGCDDFYCMYKCTRERWSTAAGC